MSRAFVAAALAAAAGLACAASADAATVRLELDPSNTGPYNEIAAGVYFMPRSSHTGLIATVLDDTGASGHSCFWELRRTLTAPAFEPEDGLSCPTAESSGGRAQWFVHVNETEQFTSPTPQPRATPPPRATSSPSSPRPTCGETWATRVMRADVHGDSDAYRGTLALRQGGKLVAAKRHHRRHRRHRDHSDLQASPRQGGGKFTLTLTADDRTRWVGMTANGRRRRGHGQCGTCALRGPG